MDWPALKDQWNGAVYGLSGAAGMLDWKKGRKAALGARAAEMGMTVPQAWTWACDQIRPSDFLSGRSGREGKYKSFKVDVDWILTPANWLKLREGKYKTAAPSKTPDDGVARPYMNPNREADRWARAPGFRERMKAKEKK